MPTFADACGQIRGAQGKFNTLLKSTEDVRPEWYLARYGGTQWQALYVRVCAALKLQPLR